MEGKERKNTEMQHKIQSEGKKKRKKGKKDKGEISKNEENAVCEGERGPPVYLHPCLRE